MDDILKRAGISGLDTEYRDAFGQVKRVGPAVLARLLAQLPPTLPAARVMPRSVVLRDGADPVVSLSIAPDLSVRWSIGSGDDAAARGEALSPTIVLPSGLPEGVFTLTIDVDAPSGPVHEEAPLIVAPHRAYQGGPQWPRRMWALAFQLYAVRSRTNWGHGDFGDLLALIDLAAALGAAGVALNPLHALFSDNPEQASPYSPSSRLFLNPLYIDLNAVPEFPGVATAGLGERVEALRSHDLVDYAGVGQAKDFALRLAYDGFRHAPGNRRSDFERFRRQHGPVLTCYAAFEVLRRKFKRPWWEWPDEWRMPDDAAVDRLRNAEPDVAYYEFVQWLADRQLARCRARAHEIGLPIGLYLDVAVGARSDGFDPWYSQSSFLRRMTIGAPPDILNTAGQNWGLTGFDPMALQTDNLAPFRRMLEASMRYAGAIRIDHVLGFKRLYVIPEGESPAHGAYLRFPLETMLAVTALLSVTHKCIVIGEDLGTVPERFRETLADWGLWSYQLLLFERGADGAFAAPEAYRENALVTFGTHDLPTFRGWRERHDLAVKSALGLDAGESGEERRASIDALRRALTDRGLENSGGPAFLAVSRR